MSVRREKGKDRRTQLGNWMRALSVLAFVLALAPRALAVEWVVPHTLGEFSYNDVAIGDFNQDGLLDIVGAAQGHGVEVWIESIDYACPSQSWIYSHGTGYAWLGTDTYYSVQAADFNRDGKLDIAAAGDNGVRVLLGNGDPTGEYSVLFASSSVNLPVGKVYRSVAVFDYQRDGDLDLIAAGDAGIDVLVNTLTGGTFGWSGAVSVVASGKYYAVATGLVDLDPIPDVVAASDTGGIKIWKGDAAGGFTAFASPVGTGRFLSVAVADVDKDGKTDIVAGSETGIYIWYGDGQGGWQDQTAKYGNARPAIKGIFQAVLALDVDQNGYTDVVGALRGGGILAWFGDKTHSWTPETSVGVAGDYRGIRVVDYDRDGLLDVAGACSNGVSVSLQKRLGEVETIQWVRGPGGSASDTGYRGVAATDIDRDGWVDVIAAKSDGGVQVWMGKPGGLSWVRAVYQTGVLDQTYDPAQEGQYYDVVAEDFNRDGVIDIAASTIDGNGIKIWLGDPNTPGKWIATAAPPVSTGNFYHLHAADIDSDGRLDLVAGSETGVKVWLNTASTANSVTWGADKGPVSTGFYAGVAVADLNRDGKLDIVAGKSGGTGKIHVWFGNGNATWWSAYSYPVHILNPSGDSSGDIYHRMWGNGYISGVAANAIAPSAVWDVVYDNLSDRFWVYRNGISTTVNPRGDTPVQNGVPYTSALGEVSFTVFWGKVPFLLNDTFTFETSSGLDGTGPKPENVGTLIKGMDRMTWLYDSVAVGDFNHDGNPDIVAGNRGGWGVQVWYGDGSGQWTSSFASPPVPACENYGLGYVTTEDAFFLGFDRNFGNMPRDERLSPPHLVGVNTNGYITEDFLWTLTCRNSKLTDVYAPGFVTIGPDNKGGPPILEFKDLSCDTPPETWTFKFFNNPITYTVEGSLSGPQAVTGVVNKTYKSDQERFSVKVNTPPLPYQRGDWFSFDFLNSCDGKFEDNGQHPSGYYGSYGAPYESKAHEISLVLNSGDPQSSPVADKYSFATYGPAVVSDGTYYDVKVADLNRDGYDDIIAANKGNGGVQVWSNGGLGVWLWYPALTQSKAWIDEENPVLNGNYNGLAVVDFNKDGWLDVVSGHDITGGLGVEVWLNVKDKVPPQVAESVIGSGASNVPINADIVLTFSEAIDDATLRAANISVQGQRSGSHTFNIYYDPETFVLTIDLEFDLDVNELVTVTLTNGIMDLAGNTLDGNKDGAAGATDDYVLTFTTKDIIPEGLAATADKDKNVITLTWFTAPEGVVDGYNVYRSEKEEDLLKGGIPATELMINPGLVPQSESPSYADDTVQIGIIYYYAVTAYASLNGYESGYSDPIEVTLYDPPPSPPANVTIASESSTSVRVSWDAPTTSSDGSTPLEDLAGYNVYVRIPGQADFTKVNTDLLTLTYLVDTTVVEGTQYVYVVRAVDLAGQESVNSAEVSVTPSLISPPRDLIVSPGDGQLTISWTAPSDVATAGGYNVYMSGSAGGPYVKQNASPVTATEQIITGLTNGTPYYFVVTTVESGTSKESGYSQEVIGTPHLPGDFNADAAINQLDYEIFSQAFGSSSEGSRYRQDADLDQDGRIDGSDLAILAGLLE